MDLKLIQDVVAKFKEDDEQRGVNRAAINDLFDGGPPFTEKECEENHFFTNVQPLMAPRVAQQARQQLARVTMRTARFFSIDCDYGSAEKRKFYSQTISSCLNKILKRSIEYRNVMRGTDATLFLHGRGPVIWSDDHRWRPEILGIEDLKVPSATYTDFSNLSHFAVYQELSAAELWRKISGRNTVKGWNVDRVKMLISHLAKDVTRTTDSANEEYFPEKLGQDLKENGAYFESDKVPVAHCWAFFELDHDKNGWNRYLLLDHCDSSTSDKKRMDEYDMKDAFLFKDQSAKVKRLEQILQVQYADGCNVAPFRYHTVRGPGFLLYPVMMLLNRMFCRSNDAIFEACNQLFRNVGEADREKLMQVILSNMSIIPTGVDFVPANERYTVNHNLLKFGLDSLRQFIAENSTSYTQDTESGTQAEMTATEAMARVQEAGEMLRGIVATKADFQLDQYREIARRFCIPASRDSDVREFRKEVMKKGVPEAALEFERWTPKMETTLGGGNKTLELAAAAELMRARAAYSPTAQTTILREFTMAITDSAEKAIDLVPFEPDGPSDTVQFANLAIGTLLQSLPVHLEDWIMPDEYAVTIVGMLDAKVSGLVQAGIQPSPETISGIMFTAQHVEDIIEAIGMDESKKMFAKQLTESLAKILEPVDQWKSIAESDPMAGIPPESRAKVAGMMLEAETRAKIKEADAQQKMAHLSERSAFKLGEDKLKLLAELEKKDVETAQSLRHDAAIFQLDAAKTAAKPSKNGDTE